VIKHVKSELAEVRGRGCVFIGKNNLLIPGPAKAGHMTTTRLAFLGMFLDLHAAKLAHKTRSFTRAGAGRPPSLLVPDRIRA
jgi:hypothetical protein